MSRIESVGNFQNLARFNQNQTPIQKNNMSLSNGAEVKTPPLDEKKEHHYIKTATNVLGVALGLGSIAGVILLKSKRPADVKLFEKLDKALKKLRSSIDYFKEKAKGDKKNWNGFFKSGLWFNKVSEGNKELFNNLVYGFGTVVVMPLVILFAPFGKKKSSEGDRVATVLRQPLSFATMFGMQLTVDKFLKDIVPKVIKKGSLDKDIMDADGKTTLYEKIQYNSDKYKEHLTAKIKEIAKMDDEAIKDLYKLSDQETIINKLKETVKAEKMPELTQKVEKYFNVKGKEKLLGESMVILGNVLFSAPVGCTLLNVIYGKTMKALDFSKREAEIQGVKKQGGQA